MPRPPFYRLECRASVMTLALKRRLLPPLSIGPLNVVDVEGALLKLGVRTPREHQSFWAPGAPIPQELEPVAVP